MVSEKVFKVFFLWEICVAMASKFQSNKTKNRCYLSPDLMMLSMKFDQNLPTDLRNILLLKCGRTTTDARPFPYQYLT